MRGGSEKAGGSKAEEAGGPTCLPPPPQERVRKREGKFLSPGLKEKKNTNQSLYLGQKICPSSAERRVAPRWEGWWYHSVVSPTFPSAL
jgi:hypothetical protein